MKVVKDGKHETGRRKMSPWLLGLLIAAVLFTIALIVFQALGFGDDPVVDPNAFPNAVEPVFRLWAAEKAGTLASLAGGRG